MVEGRPRILLFRGGAIGDFVLTLPVFQALRARWPGSYLEIVGYPHIAELARAAQLVDKVSSLDQAETARYFSYRPRFTESQREFISSFDIVISYLYDPDGVVGANMRAAGARRFVYGSPIPKTMHAADHLFTPLKNLAVYPDGEVIPRLRLGASSVAEGSLRAVELGSRVLAIHPGSGSVRKNWPLDKYLALTRRCKAEASLASLILMGDAESEIAPLLGDEQPGIAVQRGTSLVEVAETISACAAYVGNDSGITHIAAALGVPTVAIFGPTDPAVWAPRGSNVRVIRAPQPTEEGLKMIGVDEVYEALRGILP